MLKGTQRRFAIGIAAVAAVSPALLMVRPALAFPPGHAVAKFSYKFQVSTRIAKLKKTITPSSGAFTGGLDTVTNQLSGGFKLPNSSFTDPAAGLTNITAALVPTKPLTGTINRKTGKITATNTFVVHIVSASRSASSAAASPNVSGVPATLPPVTLPTLPITVPTLPGSLPTLPITLPTLPTSPPTVPPVNLVGNHCQSAKAITMTLKGTAQSGAPWKLLGTYTLPKFVQCGTLTGLLNSLLPGPGNTFSGVATTNPSAPTETLPTLPGLPITLPSLPITLPSLPVTLPTLPITLPTLPPVTLPPVTLPPVTLPTLPITLPSLPITVPTLPVH